ncbi:uncharacterized protein LOC136086351 [Hydra vulgaris]|uniref:uncharacterized protein LOC136086351 n=1 Tax=Hydra vulgaris TaxID=6087 RepID=UPI0032EA0BEA
MWNNKGSIISKTDLATLTLILSMPVLFLFFREEKALCNSLIFKFSSVITLFAVLSNADKEPDEKNEKDPGENNDHDPKEINEKNEKENNENKNNNKDEKDENKNYGNDENKINDNDIEEKSAKYNKQDAQLENLELNITEEKIQPTGSKDEYYDKELSITDDPATWSEIISQQIRDYLVKKGPPQIFPDDFLCQNDRRHFSKVHLKRKFSNGEIIVRLWIIYPVSKDRIFCFYCRLFSVRVPFGALAASEFNNWSNIYKRLPLHENSKNHLIAMLKYTDLQKKNCDARNGNFIGIIELFGKFDPIMQDHLQRIVSKTTNERYLRKHFAVILDYNPDISHKEQMPLSLKCVSDGTLPALSANIYEQFVKFIYLERSTGENLFFVLKQEIQSLGLNIIDIRGQGYDNGSNMKGKVSGVQAILLKENSRAFFTPCTCHNYNLLLGNIAKICPEAITFFGILQRLFVLFSASSKRWLVLLKYVKELTVKPICDTRWECRIQSVKAVRFQIGEFYDALFEVSETSENPEIKSEADSLGNLRKFLVIFCSFEKLLSWLINYRNTRFEHIIVKAKALAKDLEIYPEFRNKRLRKRKKHFNYEGNDEPIIDPLNTFNISFFMLVLDKAKQRYLEIALTDSKIIPTDTSNDTVNPEADF